uniref:glutathione transferase n=1 Tax=Kalanchoe fedtschenkoi TaxID=63787 RepID=A0A7N0SYP9_KALFE
MEIKEDLKLIGSFASPFVYRIIWALNLKGVEFEYVEEDILNKSQMLLKCNPVHKKVPVLIHRGKPIAESAVILEYIEETWPGVRCLLPKDPYERSAARFWVKFGEDKNRSCYMFFMTAGEKQVKAAREAREILSILESEGLKDKKYFGGSEVGMADLIFSWIPCFLDMLEEASGVKVMGESSEDFPRLKAWCQEFRDMDVVKNTKFHRQEMVAYYKRRRLMFIS